MSPNSCIRRKVPVKSRGPNIAKVVYILYLTLIGLAAETLRIKQTDLNTGLSGLSYCLVSCISFDLGSQILSKVCYLCIKKLKLYCIISCNSDKAILIGRTVCEEIK